MYRLTRPRLPLRLQHLEARIAPAIISRGTEHFTDTEILVGIRSDDPLFHLTGRVVSQRLDSEISIAGSLLLFRRDTEGAGVVQARLQTGVDPLEVITKLRGQPGIEFAEVNRVSLGDPREWVPNDPLYASPGQWHIGKMQVDKAWDITKGSPGIVVAVLDDGLPTAVPHNDLIANRWINPLDATENGIDDEGNGFEDDLFGWNFTTNLKGVPPGNNILNPTGVATHGTQVAGIIAATSNNNIGVSGVAGGDGTNYGVRLMTVRIYNNVLVESTVINGLTYAVNNGAKIVNLSYNIDEFASSPAFQNALNYAHDDRKALLFFSAGNSNTSTAARGQLNQVLFVANTKQDDSRFDHPTLGSNFGSWVDISAPGTDIITTSTAASGAEYTTGLTTEAKSGTSFAAPNAAGVAALIWSRNQLWTRDQVAAQLLGTTDNIDKIGSNGVGNLGTGRANAHRAMTETLKAPTISGVVGLPADGGLVSNLKSFSISLASRLATASVKISSFELRGEGPDNKFDTGDDAIVSLKLTPYRMGSNSIDLAINGPMNPDRYRFTMRSGIEGVYSPFGVAIDGDDNGSAGGDFVRTFDAAVYELQSAPIGNEIQINTYTQGVQREASVALDAQGNSLIVWTRESGVQGDYDVYAQRFDADGAQIGGEFRVNTFTLAHQQNPDVAMDANGNAVVVWNSQFQDGDETGVYGQRYDAAGSKVGPEFKVNSETYASQENAAVEMDTDGDFVIVWESYGQDGKNLGVFGQRFDATGNKQGVEFQVNTYTTQSQELPSVAMSATGDFVVVWQSAYQGPAFNNIFGQRFNSSGAKVGGEFQVSDDNHEVNEQPEMAMDAVGNFVVVWQDFSSSGENSRGISGQRFDSTGTKAGPEFRVNTITLQNQRVPSIAMDADGDSLVAWESYSQDGSSYGIFGQRFDPAGNKVNSEFQINSFTSNNQRTPKVAVNSEGDAIVTWQSFNQDGSNYGIYGQRFGPVGVLARVEQVRTTNGAILPNGAESSSLVAGLIVTFSQELSTIGGKSGSNSVTNPANWSLSRNSSDINDRISKITFALNAQTNRYEATISFSSSLFVGSYSLTAKDSIQDSLGNAIDGNADGLPGGQHVRSFGVAAQTPIGPEFAVGSNGSGGGPAVATNASGQTLVVLDGGDIRGQRIDADGNKIGLEFQVNTFTTDIQHSPAVAVDADGDAIVVWTSQYQDGSEDGVFGQRFDANGNKVGAEFQVNTYTTHQQRDASVAIDATGNSVVVWSNLALDQAVAGIYGQRFDSAGNKIGGEFRVSTLTTESNNFPSISIDADGDFVVAWDSYLYGDYHINGQRFDSAANKVSTQFRVNTTTFGQRYEPKTWADAAGNFAVVWSGVDIIAQRFDAAGSKLGSEFRINSYTLDTQQLPSISGDAAGNMLVVWQSLNQEAGGNDFGVYGQWIDPAGTKIGGEFRVHTNTAGDQQRPAVALDADGDGVVVWSSFAQGGSSNGVYAQRVLTNNPPTSTVIAAVNMVEDTPPVPLALWNVFSDDRDPDSALSFSVIKNNPAGIVSTVIDNKTGQLSIISEANASGSLSLTVRSTDTHGYFTDESFAVNVASVNDPPTFVKGNNIILPVNFVEQTYSNWATNISPGPSDETSQSVAFEIVANSRPDLFTRLELLPDGTLIVDPTDQIYGAAIIQIRAIDNGGTANGGQPNSVPLTFTVTIVPDYSFGYAGPGIRANSTSAGAQNQSAMAVDGSGNTIGVWAGNGPGDADGIFGQRFNLQGKQVGSEFRVNSTVANAQQFPDVAMTHDGKFVVVWEGNGPGDSNGIFLQRFLADGTPIGDESRVNTTTIFTQSNASVSTDLAGNFVVTWSNGNSVVGQRFDTAGNKLAGEFSVNTTSTGGQFDGRVSMSADGRFVATWTSGDDIRFRRFHPDGAPADVNDLIANYFTTGVQQQSDIALDADGDFVITWHGAGATDADGIFARRFGIDGTPKDAMQLSVNVTTTGTQANPRVSIDADGDFAVTWHGYGTTDADGVFVRRFLADGTSPDAKGLRANTFTVGAQTGPAISMDHDGEFVVTWTSANQDGDGDGVYLQRFGFPLPPVQTKALEDAVVFEDGADTVYPLFEYFSSATGKTEGMEYTVFSVTDPGGALNGTPTINPTSGVLTVRYATNRSGQGNITIRVRDTTEVPTLTTFKFTVIPVNDAPELAAIDSQIVNEGSLVTFSAVGTDPFDIPPNNLIYSLIGAPMGATIHPTTGKFDWIPADGPATVTFTVRVTDDGTTNSLPDAKSADRSVTITVANLAPTATGVTGPATVEIGKMAAFAIVGANDAPGDVPTLKYSFDWNNDGVYEVVDSSNATEGTSFAKLGMNTIRARVSDKDGAFSSAFVTDIIVTSGANNPPKVQSVSVNDGLSNQRSRVDSLTIAFNSLVDFTGSAADAFEVLRTGPGSPMSAVQIAGVDSSASTMTQTIAKITFTGGVTEFGSLVDGNYSLRLLASKISTGGVALDGDGDGTPGDDYMGFTFHRLFGDADGNRSITAADFNAFRLAYGIIGPSAFDFNNDNQVSAADFNAFRLRYGVTLAP